MKVSPIVIREDEILATAARDLDALGQARMILGADGAAFTIGPNQTIWAAMIQLSDRGRPVAELSALAAAVGNGADVERLQWLLSDKSPRVQPDRLVALCHDQRQFAAALQIRKRASSLASISDLDAYTAPDAIHSAACDLRDASMVAVAGGFKTPAELAVEVVQEMVDRTKNGGPPAAPTGIAPLDDAIDGGLQTQRVYVKAGRPGNGKTSLALQSALHMAALGHPVLYFSREMPGKEMTKRAVQIIGRLDGRYPGMPGAIAQDGRDWMTAMARFGQLTNLWIEDTVRDLGGALSRGRAWLRTDAARIIGESPNGNRLVPVIMFDYLQKFSVSGSFQSREAEVAKMSVMCSDFAMDTNCAIDLLCQINRDNVKQNRPPQESDLRESGAIEQDAKAIIFVHQTTSKDERKEKLLVPAQVILEKNTFGATGTLTVGWRPRSTRFESYPPIDEP